MKKLLIMNKDRFAFVLDTFNLKLSNLQLKPNEQ
jgi:hypothetical protein